VMAVQQPQPAPGTAGLYEMIRILQAELGETRAQWDSERAERDKQRERMRAMVFCWGDDLEREMGYSTGDRPPRTAEIRQIWREMGQPARKRTNEQQDQTS